MPETPGMVLYTRPGCPFSAKLKVKAGFLADGADKPQYASTAITLR